MDIRDGFISFGMDPEFLEMQGEPDHFVQASKEIASTDLIGMLKFLQ